MGLPRRMNRRTFRLVMAQAVLEGQRNVIKRPSLGSILLALIPFGGMCFSVPLWDRLTPRIWGLPFNIFWILAWLAVTPALMCVVYHREKKR
jgi:hypothetical protein